jgi:hypothetical protein
MSDSKALSRQVLEDFAESKITVRAEAPYQTLDRQTFADLELQNIADILHEYAPTKLSRERIDWLIHHPSLDRGEILLRQQAIRTIADNDEIYEGLAQMFGTASNQPESLAKKLFRSFLYNPNDITHKDIAEQFKSDGLASTQMLQQLVNVGVAGYLQYGLVHSVSHFMEHPGFWSGLGVPAALLFLATMTSQATTDLALRAAHDRAHQMQQFSQANVGDSPSLEGLQTLCKDNRDCVNSVSRLRWLYPLKGKTALIFKALGFAPLSLLPSQIYMQKKRTAVLRMLAAMVELETYYAFAKYYRESKDELIFPEILDPAEGARFSITEGHNPFLWMQGKPSIPNSIDYDEHSGAKVYVMTGPNAGGKTTFQQMQLVSAVMAMMGLPVPAKSMKTPPVHLFTNFTTNNGRLQDDKSTFNKQSERAIELFHFVEEHSPSLTASDEILVGTSTPEHEGLEHGAVKFIHDTPGALATMTTHDRRLTNIVEELPHTANIQVLPEGHKIAPGASTVYNAYKIMQAAGAPDRFMNDAIMYFRRFNPNVNCETMIERKPD